jgi:hypothetical protein
VAHRQGTTLPPPSLARHGDRRRVCDAAPGPQRVRVGLGETTRQRPRAGVSAGQGPFVLVWRVMDSNQRRTTPTVLQGRTTTSLDLRLHSARALPPRAFPATARYSSSMAVDSGTTVGRGT